ncbi:MAG: sigma-70 family RNA polymerase sigma factor [Ilumatobacteraceae bacterium]
MSRWRQQAAPVEGAEEPDRRARFDAAFAAVYEPLQAYARRRADHATADDVVAEALLVLWRRLDEVPTDLVLPWCYGVARRCLANQRRADHRRNALVDRLTAERSQPTEAEADPALEAALAALSADDREIVRLWAWEQLQPREIGTVLDISANAAAIRVHRAKQRLAEAMADATGKNSDRAGHTVVGHAKEAP